MAYKRKTHTEYDIQGAYGEGWETVCTELTWKEAKERLQEYHENECLYPHRIKINSRVPNEEAL